MSAMQRGLRRGLILAALLLAGGALMLGVRAWMASDGTVTGKAAIGGPFTLVDQDGRTVTEASFRGKLMLVYFGFTYCPDVCPTELMAMSEALDLLGPDAGQVTPVFITVDPERDTAAVLHDYLAGFHSRFVGLTGTPEQAAAAARAWRVYYAKVRDPNSAAEYLMDHSGFVYLMDRQGAYLAHFRPNTPPEDMAARIKAAL